MDEPFIFFLARSYKPPLYFKLFFKVRIFNSNEEYYVRNDISLSGPPLCLCYIHTEIGEELEEDKTTETEYSSNFVAIGSITNEIQIWDLDVIDSPGPEYTFTGHKKGASVVRQSFKIIWFTGQSFDFWWACWFLDSWRKFWFFLPKLFDFWKKIRFLTKNFDFWPKFRFLAKVSIFG